jgi:alkylation response protein AidB-like acyl-CoA dehydrogenase
VAALIVSTAPHHGRVTSNFGQSRVYTVTAASSSPRVRRLRIFAATRNPNRRRLGHWGEYKGWLCDWSPVPSSYAHGAGARASRRTAEYATEAAQAKIFTSEMAIKVTNDALQLFGAAGYSRNRPLERMVRDARMFTIGGGTAQILRTVVASRLLGRRLPQSRDGYVPKTGSG